MIRGGPSGKLKGLADVTDGNVEATSLKFTNTTPGGGNPTLFVAPDVTAPFESLSDSGERSYDYNPGADGYYTLAYEFRLVTGESTFRKVSVVQDFKCVDGVCSLEGSAVPSNLGVQTGVALEFSIVDDAVRVTLTNTTGSALSGYYWRATAPGDLPT